MDDKLDSSEGFSGTRLAELREYGNKNQTVIYLYEYHDDSPCLCQMVLISKKYS